MLALHVWALAKIVVAGHVGVAARVAVHVPAKVTAGEVKTTRKTGGLHKPYKGLRQAAPKGAVKRSADRI